MEFLDKIVIPQSPHHIELLQYVLGFTFLILMPYLAILLGGTIMSYFAHKRGLELNDSKFLRLSKELIDIVTVNKSAAFALGLVPMLSVIFAYAQLMQGAANNITGNLVFAFLVFVSGVVSVYVYKYSFQLKHIFSIVTEKGGDDLHQEFESYKSSANQLLAKAGPFALVLLLLSSYIFIAAIQFGINSSAWEGSHFFSVLLSPIAITYYLHFVAVSFTIAALGFLYVRYRNNEKSGDTEYDEFVKGFLLKSAMIFILIQPILILLNVISLPRIALTGPMFISIIFILGLLLILAVMTYFMLKDLNLRFRTQSIFLIMILFVVFVVRDVSSFESSAQLHFKELGRNYAAFQADFKESMGIVAVEISGEDIYNGRCIACHQFDQKVVGPPYNDVLVKYEGKMEDLANFILNPVKVDPAYPAMPNQGLKPNEAKAIAEYLMTTYESRK